MEAAAFPPRTFDLGEDRIRFQGLAMNRAAGWMTEADPQHGFLLAACGTGERARELPRLVGALRGAILGGPARDGTAPPAASGRPAAAMRPPAIERLVLCLRQTHALLGRSPGSEASDGLSVLIALYDQDRLHIVHAGGRLRLTRLNATGACEPLAGRLPGASPALVGGANVVRIEVGSEPTRTGDLFVALPVAVEPDAAEEMLIASLARWQSEVAGQPETAELAFPLEALPQAFACLAIESAAAGYTAPIAGEIEPPTAPTTPDAWSDLLATAREAVQEIAESRAEDAPQPGVPSPTVTPLTGRTARTAPQPSADPPTSANVARHSPQLEIVKFQAGGGAAPRLLDDDAAESETVHTATVQANRPAVHPWVARRQRRAARRSGQTWLVLTGILSAIAGTVGVLAATGTLERLLPAAGPWLPGQRVESRPVKAAHGTTLVRFPIVTDPAGAELMIDGETTGRRTPVTDLELEPGTYSIELSLADLGSWQGEIIVPVGDATAAGLELPLTGTLSARTDRPVSNVAVHVDGQRVGLAPIRPEQLRAGVHIVRFATPTGFSWEEEVLVRVDQSIEVVAPIDGVESRGLVTVRSVRAGESGTTFVDGDRVAVDGAARGRTPEEIHLTPGRYLIEVRRDRGGAIQQIVEVRAGDHRFVDLCLDRVPSIRIEHESPAALDTGRSPLLTVRLRGQGLAPEHAAYVHLELDGVWRRVTLGAVPGAQGTYVVGLPVTPAHAGTILRYYFDVADPSGVTSHSAIFSVPLR